MPETFLQLYGANPLLSVAALLEPRAELLVLPASTDHAIPWAGMRLLLAKLVELRGEPAVREALLPQRVALSLVLRELSELDDDELARRELMTPQPSGFMSHNSMLAAHLRLAWVAAVGPLLTGLTACLPDPIGWDPPSLNVLLAAGREHGLRLVVGSCELTADDPRERGHRRQIHALLTRARLSVSSSELHGQLPRSAAARPIAPFDDALELRAWAAPTDEQLSQHALARAFACFGYRFVERLGSRLLAAALDPAQHREVHRMVALAAYNQQVSTRGESPQADRELSERLDHHFHAALDGESDPAWQAHLLYRLAINEGRRRGQQAEALAFAERSIAVATAAELPVERAWALNARAYLRARAGDLPGAIADEREAEQLLARPIGGALEGERIPAQLVLLDNLAELHLRAGELEQARHWEARRAACIGALPGRWLPGLRGVELLRRQHHIVDAIARLDDFTRVARELLDPYAEDRALAELAVLHHQRGDAEAAYTTASAALATVQQFGEPDAIRAAELCVAMAALRLHRPEAVDALVHVLEQTEQPSARVELTATLAWAHAKLGHAEASERLVNEAIEQAVELGFADTLARVACAAGEACLALARFDDAAQAFAQARELASSCEPSDRFIAASGCLYTHTPTHELVDEALALLEQALDEPEAWWELPRLARALEQLGRAQPLALREALTQRL